jgi:hypothetical protein
VSLSVKEPGSSEAKPTIIIAAAEVPADRENATHFATWGVPEARSTPRMSPHSIHNLIVANDCRCSHPQGLPSQPSYRRRSHSHQSHIYGGAIDTYALGSSGSAAVIFTTADASDTYFAKYPNGVTFKYKGKNVVAVVEKNTGVNVDSGMLRVSWSAVPLVSFVPWEPIMTGE